MTTPTNTATAVPYVVAGGDPFAVGAAHGGALRDSLHGFLDDGLARLNHLLPAPVSLPALAPRIAAYRQEINRQTPDLGRELDGLAAGAGISRDAATLLQLRREITGYHKVQTLGDCTAYARPGVLAQTVDLNGGLGDQTAVLNVGHALVLSFGGLLGYLGVNSAGLAVGITLVLGGTWRVGLPPYLAIRHLLDTADSVDGALRVLRSLRLSSSRVVMLADRDTTAVVEVLGDTVHVVPDAQSCHTNHFLHPDLVTHDDINVFARNSSLRRLAAVRDGLSDLPCDADVSGHFAVLCRPPIPVPDSGDLTREHTVATVVLDACHRELHLRPGDPRESATQTFVL